MMPQVGVDSGCRLCVPGIRDLDLNIFRSDIKQGLLRVVGSIRRTVKRLSQCCGVVFWFLYIGLALIAAKLLCSRIKRNYKSVAGLEVVRDCERTRTSRRCGLQRHLTR